MLEVNRHVIAPAWIALRAISKSLILLLPLASMGSACATSDTGVDVDAVRSGAACKFASDCSAQKQLCAFPVADGCNATGVCVARSPQSAGISCASTTICGCDGKTTGLNNECPYPSGYGSIPYAHVGVCGTEGDGEVEASSGSRTPCQASADCAKTQELCAYPIADGCTASGICLKPNPAARGVSCASKTVCGCDGKTTGLNNECPYPSGYGSAPYAGDGACASDGGADAD